MKKIAIMQPYLFPYLGYFQLISAVDIFVFYDDVKYTKSHWYNRNSICENGKKSLFTFPILRSSTSGLIKDVCYVSNIVFHKEKLKKRLKYNYKLEKIMVNSLIDMEELNLANFNIATIKTIAKIFDFNVLFVRSSELDLVDGDRVGRIIEICRKLGCKDYFNPIGGMPLYNKDEFGQYDIKINFLNCLLADRYSIIHEMLSYDIEELKLRLIENYELC